MCLDEYYSTPDDEYSNSCTKGTYSFVRLLFWILGFMGKLTNAYLGTCRQPVQSTLPDITHTHTKYYNPCPM